MNPESPPPPPVLPEFLDRQNGGGGGETGRGPLPPSPTPIMKVHTCQLSLFWLEEKKGGGGAILSCVPIFAKNLLVVLYRKFRNVPIYKHIPPICPYFLRFRVGKYESGIWQCHLQWQCTRSDVTHVMQEWYQWKEDELLLTYRPQANIQIKWL